MKRDNGNKVLQRLAGLAAGCGLGCFVLQAEPEVSQRRFVRDHKSIAAIFGISGGQYCGRAWSGKFSFVRAIFADFAGLLEGNRNAHHHCGKARIGKSRRFACGAGDLRRNWQNDQSIDTGNSGQKMKTLFAIRYSLFAPLRSCHV
jgi:hypothetical protein